MCVQILYTILLIFSFIFSDFGNNTWLIQIISTIMSRYLLGIWKNQIKHLIIGLVYLGFQLIHLCFPWLNYFKMLFLIFYQIQVIDHAHFPCISHIIFNLNNNFLRLFVFAILFPLILTLIVLMLIFVLVNYNPCA